MKLKTIILTTIITSSLVSKAQTLDGLLNQAKDAVITNSTTIIDAAKSNSTAVLDKATSIVTGTPKAPALTNEEVINGLKEALTVGTNNSSGVASKADGYLKNPKIFIPWPEEAKDMRAKLIKMGMQKKVTEFETSLNRAAEEAAKKSAPVFKDAITGMSIGDGFAILNGGDTAATHYLREKTYAPLKKNLCQQLRRLLLK